MITNEIKAKIFGLYLGCSYRYYDKQAVVDGLVISDIEDNDHAGNPKLILKPLSEITDEDKREFLEVTGMEPDGLDLFLLGHGSMHLSHLQDWANGVDFLRSRSYALPYKGQCLFESGIALKPNK